MDKTTESSESELTETTTEQCLCPDTYPDWHDTTADLSGYCVHRMPVSCFFFMPLAYDLAIAKQTDNIVTLGVEELWLNFAMIQTGMFKGYMLRLLKAADSPSHHIQFLPSPFQIHAALHHGTMGTINTTVRAQQTQLIDLGRKPKNLLLAHLSCPVCADRKGGEKILVMRRWEVNQKLLNKIRPLRQYK